MSDIPKSKRAWSKLEALDKAIAIRGELSRELLISFGLSEKHIDKDPGNVRGSIL